MDPGYGAGRAPGAIAHTSKKPYAMTQGRANARLEALCDGIFAIALTLLILDVKLPPTERIASTAAGRISLDRPRRSGGRALQCGLGSSGDWLDLGRWRGTEE